MDYDDIVLLSRVVSLLLFGGMFIGILVYAFRPSSKEKFDRYARIPLRDD